jgi:trehalose 6-phosphate phosphatase
VRALVAFDFDGTLAPLGSDPAAAALSPSTRALLRVTALLWPCAVISGRARADLAGRVSGIPLAAVLGSHGGEPGFGPLDRTARAAVVRWREALSRQLAGVPGIRIEDEGLLLAIHHCAARPLERARRLALAAAGALDGARVALGRAVVHVLPADGTDKGAAIEAVLAREGLDAALYVGDDGADEEAFGAPGVSVAIRVGRSARSRARWYLPAQERLDDLLRALIEARARLDGRRRPADALARALR